MSADQSTVRLDRWLWAARFFKTRQLASDAVQGGKVHVNGQRSKPARPVRAGDDLEITKGPYRFQVRVEAVAARRGPASAAQGLYTEHAASIAERTARAAQMRSAAQSILYEHRRPEPRQRRAARDLKRGPGPADQD